MDQQANERKDVLADCDRTRRHALEYLDGELEQSLATAITIHIEICPPCGKRITFEAAFLRTVSRGRTAATLPPSMEERLAVLLREWKQGNA
jgi:anti-sigma factor (TIGR02949 family)